MSEPIEIILSDKKPPSLHIPIQLYNIITFRLPSLGELQLPSLQKAQISQIQDHQQELIPPHSYQFSYNTKYQQTVASHQFFPFCITINEKYVAVAGKGEILVFNEIDFSSFFKIKFDQIVTAMDLFSDMLLIGTQTGKIVLYNILKKSILSESTFFAYPILRLKMLSYCRLYAIDSLGGCAYIQFNINTIFDKMIVTSTDEVEIFQVNKKKNKDKIKKLWKNILNKQQQALVPQLKEYQNDFAIAYRQFSGYLNPNQLCLAVFRNQKISIFTLGNVKSQIKNQQKILEQTYLKSVGIIKFGIGGFQTSNQTHMFLVVSSQKTINYIRFVRIDETYEWHHVYSTHTNYNIISGSFLSNNLLVLLSERGIELAAVGQTPELVTPVQFNNFGYINFFNSQQNAKINISHVYRSILRGSWKLNFFCCLQGKRVIIGNVQNWKSYLQIYQNQNKWQDVIKYSMLIFHGKFKLLSGIPENKQQRKQQMQIYFQSIIMAYLSFQLNQYPDKIEQTIELTIKFLLDIENFQCLFVSIYEALIQHRDMFFNKLQKFIYLGKVKTISNQALDDAIKYYQNKKSIETIQALMMNLDLDIVDKAMVLQTCIQKQLFCSLINICVSTKDFITPMVKLSSLITLKPEINVQEQKIGKTIMSYVKNCLDGYYIDYHDDQKYLDMLIGFIAYFVLPISLKLVSKTDPTNFFRLLELFFQGRVFQLILQNSDRFNLKNNTFPNNFIFQKSSCSQFDIYDKILKNIIFTDYIILQSNRHEQELQKFLLFLVLKNQFPFNTQIKMRAVNFLIHNPKIFFQQKQNISEQQQADINGYLMRLFDSIFSRTDDQQKQDKISIMIALICSTQNEQLLCESLCYLYHMQQKFKKVFDTYLKMKNKILRQRIICYLQQNLFYPELIEETLSNIMSLLKIDEQRTINLFITHLSNYCEQVINKLSGYPKYQLKYLEALFKTEHVLKAELKLIHLNIVLKYDKNQIEHFLKSMDYPLDQAYKICQQAGHKPAMAFLSVKKGKIREGLTILIDIFCELSDEVVKQLARKQLSDKTQLRLRLKQMIQVCADLSMQDIVQGQAMWFQLLDKVFKHIKIDNLVKQNVPPSIKQLLGQIVQTILTQMCKYITIEFFIERFAHTFSTLPINIFYRAYSQMNDRLVFNVKVNNLVLTVCESDHFERQNVIRQFYSMGFESDGKCDKCHIIQSQLEDPKIVFRCQHTFHLGCLTKIQCQICPKTESDYSEQPEILRDNHQIIPLKKNKQKRQKLQKFDEELHEIESVFSQQFNQATSLIKIKSSFK